MISHPATRKDIDVIDQDPVIAQGQGRRPRRQSGRGCYDELGEIIRELERLWTDDHAAMAFYTALEREAGQ